MELEEQSGVDTCKGDSEKICWPLVQAERQLGREAGGVQSRLEGKRLWQVRRAFHAGLGERSLGERGVLGAWAASFQESMV